MIKKFLFFLFFWYFWINFCSLPGISEWECWNMRFSLMVSDVLVKTHQKYRNLIKNQKSKNFWALQIIYSSWFQQLRQKSSKLKEYFQKNFFAFLRFLGSPEDSETSFGPNHGFPRKFSGESLYFSKSRSLWEAVSSSLLVGFGCPDTRGLSTDSSLLISVGFDRIPRA